MTPNFLASRCAAGLLAICAGLASAQATAPAQPAPPVQLDTVSVTLQRDPAMLPYARMNELLTKLQQHGQGLFRMEFKLRQKDPQLANPHPKLAVQHADRYIPITVRPDGTFDLPVIPQEQANDAELASNLPKNNTGVSGTLHLTTRPDQLDMAKVRHIMATAQSLRSKLLPWYLRVIFPQVEGVRICSARPDWELEWREAGQLLGLPLTADPRDRDPDERGSPLAKGQVGKPCTTLTGQEQWPDAARLLAPPDAKISVRLSTSG